MSENRALQAKNKLFKIYAGGIIALTLIFGTLTVTYFLLAQLKMS
ncbi:hypothetical protein [Rhodoferax sp. U2-2l]|nr:hypothetical protein [Rhodoferax sp. U2-2l]